MHMKKWFHENVENSRIKFTTYKCRCYNRGWHPEAIAIVWDTAMVDMYKWNKTVSRTFPDAYSDMFQIISHYDEKRQSPIWSVVLYVEFRTIGDAMKFKLMHTGPERIEIMNVEKG